MGRTLGYGGIVLCQPDSRKGCAACCGLFNLLDISRENLEAFLRGGAARAAGEEGPADEACRSPFPVRDATSYICPYQGFLEPGRPGCLLHPAYAGRDTRDRSLYGAGICDGFLCPAHSILTEDEKRALIDSVDDWYLYSVAIIDPDTFLCMLRALPQEARSGAAASEALVWGLEEHARRLAASDVPVFSYSPWEYVRNKKFLPISG
ncbi:MAG: hypothetical protein JXA20_13730 [Spirochaetes bacterium]|nr:hypothetical protein [Spirochaetota bacterium]